MPSPRKDAPDYATGSHAERVLFYASLAVALVALVATLTLL